jgi:succinate dehydrogenase/fumarate reductase flavoprotein subunit
MATQKTDELKAAKAKYADLRQAYAKIKIDYADNKKARDAARQHVRELQAARKSAKAAKD